MRSTLNRKLMVLALGGALITGGITLAQDDSAPGTDDAPVEASESAGNLMATLRADANYSVFVSLLESSGLMAILNDGNSYTIFAPTNAAIDALDVDLDLASTELETFVRSHLISGHYAPADLAELDSVMAMRGGDVSVSSSDGALTVGDVEIASEAIVTDNGVIYKLDEAFPAAVMALEASITSAPADQPVDGESD